MNKKERLKCVLDGNIADYPPVGFWHHFEGDEEKGAACVDAHVRFFEQTDIDFIKIMSDGLYYPLKVRIEKPEDWYDVKPLPRDDSFYNDSVKRCFEINKIIGNECYTFYNFFSPFNIIRESKIFAEDVFQGLSGDSIVMQHMRTNEDAIKHALMIIAKDLAYLSGLIINEGHCLGIYQSVQGAEKGRMTGDEYARIVEPSDRHIIETANNISPYNILHMCSWAGHPNNLTYWKDYPCRVKNWGVGIEGLSLSEAKNFFPKGSVFLGGMDNRRTHPLFAGDEKKIKSSVRKVLDEMKNEPFILGADCTVPADIDLNHIRWAVEAARE